MGQRKGPRGEYPAAGQNGYGLFDFDVIAGVNIHGAVSDEDGRGVVAYVKDNTLAQHFARQVVPVIPSGRAAETIETILIPFRLRSEFRERSLVSENSKIIADFYAFVGTEIDVHGVTLPGGLLIIPRRNDHRHRLPADGGKMVERGGVLEHRIRPLLERQDDIAALHIVARKRYFRDRDLWLNSDHTELPC